MDQQPAGPPYFEQLFEKLDAGDPTTTAAFGRHVHWGYWDAEPDAICTPDQFGDAAERLTRSVIETARIADGQRILDVGCGFGGTIASLNEQFNIVEMVGVNIDPRQLARARTGVLPENQNSIEFQHARAEELPFDDESFDIVLAVECAFHFDRAQFLAEASRVLRRGGNLTVSDFIPSERAQEYIEALDLVADEAIRWTFGQIDLTWSANRYREFSANHDLELTVSRDITSETLPTYDFLRENIDRWTRSEDVGKFNRAIGKLEKASRRGFLEYQILRLDKMS